MIDLHSHILPALDDGALDLADSVAMARVAARDGIATVCATPHIRDDHDVRIEQLPARIAELQGALDGEGVDLRVVQGGEVSALAADRLSDEHLRAVSLGGGGWILLEPAPGPISDELPALVERLAKRGARTIVAHPERHAGAGFESWLGELLARGCLLQWTAQFLLDSGEWDADGLMPRLAREGLVHLLASDAHSSHGGRALKLSHGAAWLRERGFGELASWSVEAGPAAVLRGEAVTPPPAG